MSHSLSREEQQQLQELLRKGGYTAPMPMAEESVLFPPSECDDWDWSKCSEIEVESMTDASKRRLTEQGAGQEGYGQTQLKQLPTPLTGVPTESITLPEGVTSIEDWGRTVMEKGKLARLQLSYSEIFKSRDSEVEGYVKWLLANISPKHDPQFHDLHKYLKIMTASAASSSSLIPGTHRARKLK